MASIILCYETRHSTCSQVHENTFSKHSLTGMLQERLKNQKEEAASNPEYGSSYKPKASKEDKQAKRKQILSNIGEPLVGC